MKAVKEFAHTLHYYSPQAYEYCRSILKLPDPSSIRNWLLNANIDTSFLQSVLLKLQHKPDIEKDCALIIDSMSIRKQTLYNSHTGKYDGFVDYGPGGMVGAARCNSESAEATHNHNTNCGGAANWLSDMRA